MVEFHLSPVVHCILQTTFNGHTVCRASIQDHEGAY